jgi:hypothetical protein
MTLGGRVFATRGVSPVRLHGVLRRRHDIGSLSAAFSLLRLAATDGL